jgi:hypothetical protein
MAAVMAARKMWERRPSGQGHKEVAQGSWKKKPRVRMRKMMPPLTKRALMILLLLLCNYFLLASMREPLLEGTF